MLGRLVLFALSAVALSACDSGTTRPIRAVGSSTVFPFTTAVAEAFVNQDKRRAAPVIESIGSGAGFRAFCEGVGSQYPDIANASRRMKRTEYDTCQKNNVGEILEVQIGLDGVVLAESWYDFLRTDMRLMLLQSGTSLLAILAFGAAMLSANAELLFDADAPRPAHPPLSPAEHVLKQKLDAAMAAHVHRESGLTIGVLAGKLGVPEHRLRALINQRLGYRNFSDFLNSHRVADAKAWLGDPARVDLPVLTLAMDLGYGSLAPFNRAFRDATGTSPSEYRRAAILDPEKG